MHSAGSRFARLQPLYFQLVTGREERQRGDFGARAAFDSEFSSGREVLAANVAERDAAAERGRIDHGCEPADLFALASEFGASGGPNLAAEVETNQTAVDVAAGANSFDDFLADVTAFGVADGAGLEASFRRQRALVHVYAVARQAGFGAQDVEGGVADRFPADGRLLGRERVPEILRVLDDEDETIAFLAALAQAHDQHRRL